MYKTVVKRLELLDKVKENLKNHENSYKEALVEYKELYFKTLNKIVDDANNNQIYKTNMNISPPQSYIKHYTRAISMIEMEVNDTVELDQTLFSQLVLDEWEWRNSYDNTTLSNKMLLSAYK